MNKKIFLIITVLIIIIGGYFLLLLNRIGTPPGCRTQIPFVAGGCFAKFKITDEKISPNIPCIKLDVNNCTNPGISVINECQQDIYIEGEKIPYEFEQCWIPTQYYYFSRDEISKRSALITVGENNFNLDFSKNTGNMPKQYDKCLRFVNIKDMERLEISCEEIVKAGKKIFTPSAKQCQKNYIHKGIAGYTEAPTENIQHSVKGGIGNDNFTISYTVTKKLCK